MKAELVVALQSIQEYGETYTESTDVHTGHNQLSAGETHHLMKGLKRREYSVRAMR